VQQVQLVNSTPETFGPGPIALLIEMLVTSVLERRWCSRCRSNLAVVLKKSQAALHAVASPQ
jgi:hypothetical protein